jgi:glutamate dehydrogenase (NADP+)
MKKQILENLKNSNNYEDSTFIQAVSEVLTSLEPLAETDKRFETYAIFERLVTPDREIKFKIQWVDDNNQVHVNNGYRIQFNNSLGPYKGGLRFHKSVNSGILKFLAFEQIFKNSLTGLPIGGAKGGSDFDPKGKSDFEIMKFCRAFMRELYQYIGARIDVPAGDIGVGSREIGFLYGEYKRITRNYDGVLTGKPFTFGGSQLRPEATGYGVVYFASFMLQHEISETLQDKICVVSGSGNVAIYTIEKLQKFGAKVVACSDSDGMIFDSNGLELKTIKNIKINSHKSSLENYIKEHKNSRYIPKKEYPESSNAIWNIKCDVAFACATQNELTLVDAKNLIKNGCKAVIEGANMPTTPDAIDIFLQNNILFAPAKAANAGGVIVSEFEMSQNATMETWQVSQVDQKLQKIMQDIYFKVSKTAQEFSKPRNFTDGANIAAFKRVAEAMILEGV